MSAMSGAARTGFAIWLLAAGGAAAQDPAGGLSALGQFQTNGTQRQFEPVDQQGRAAAQIKATLATIRLPDGFKIELYAIVPGARHMAVAPGGQVILVGTRHDDVWAVIDRNGDHRVDAVRPFLPAIDYTIPNGVCFAPDGTLYIAEQNRVLAVPDAGKLAETSTLSVFSAVAQGDLIPREEESRGHSARVCRVGPDDRLYVALGQPYNVSPPSKLEKYDRTGIGGIVRFNRDGTGREVYARGIRNSVGMDFNPANGELWFTDNQVDRMGDDIPPGELNRAAAPGQHFGFPWFGGGDVRTNEYRNSVPPAGHILPEVEMIAHAADLGMIFYRGSMFPQKYRGGVFNAQHGSWDRSTPVGARIMFTAINPDGGAGETEIFADGWLRDDGSYAGRPVDVAQLSDGSLLVSDDFAGALYRIGYGG